jgi:hypothetical protein
LRGVAGAGTGFAAGVVGVCATVVVGEVVVGGTVSVLLLPPLEKTPAAARIANTSAIATIATTTMRRSTFSYHGSWTGRSTSWNQSSSSPSVRAEPSAPSS